MKKIIFTLIIVLISSFAFGQRKLGGKGTVKTKKEDEALMDSLNYGNSNKNGKKVKFEDTEITDYLIISSAKDTTYVDTTLSIKKEYKFNYLRKDEFGLMPFANVGQTYNSLTYSFNEEN